MAMLAVADDRLRQVDEFAKTEEHSREDVVGEAIDMYLCKKKWDKIFKDGDRLTAKNGITEEVVAEEIRKYREEKRNAEK